jgi:hypothetical protein
LAGVPAAKSSRRALTSDNLGGQGRKMSTFNPDRTFWSHEAICCDSLYLGSSVVVTGGLDGGVLWPTKFSNSVDANGDKNMVSVESTWTGGVQVEDTRLDRRQLRWMESTG